MSQYSEPQTASSSRRALPPSRPPSRFRPFFWVILFGIILPVAISQVPLEIGRWHFARAEQLRAKGKKEAAYQELDAANGWFPNRAEILLKRAQWKLSDGQREEALAAADRAVEKSQDGVGANALRGVLLLEAGEFERAVEDLKKVVEFSRRSGIPPLKDALNQLAYARALQKANLDEALTEITEAIDLCPTEADKAGPQEYFVKGLFLDTRGYIYFLQDEFELAVQDLNEAVERVEKSIGIHEEGLAEDAMPPAVRAALGQGSSSAKAAAVIRYHRSLALDALDRHEEAEKDRAMVRRLTGRDPDETLY